ncbi:AAA family ATPase [Alkaliphilus transvaalensis]|uniref:AAA family ATPase n=1 Tax=Alkaliphilus transvaalensis TaxID=114628 RepID=UPI000B0E5BFE|nr:MoxR family ATPase [Alkaliphilus transvaalensis]
MIEIKEVCDRIKDNVSKVIVGKEDVIDLLLVSLITSGHVLLEDVPGLGKTQLAKSFAKSIDCSFNRIQFTPDLLPSDVTGINFYNQTKGEFEFRKGPVFYNIILADEINRATPRTQSSLLEAMEETQVSIDGVTYILEKPFMVIATQNPVEQQGTFPLPEAQLDRFLMKISIGYPSKEEEKEILNRYRYQNPLATLQAVATQEDILNIQKNYTDVYLSEELMEYIIDLVHKTRDYPSISLGVSPRGSLALMRASQAYAIIQGRDYVLPDDIQKMAIPILSHRILCDNYSHLKGSKPDEIIQDLINEIKTPLEQGVN